MYLTLISIIVLLAPNAEALEAYYGRDLASWNGQVSAKLKSQLFLVLNNYHLEHENQPDDILAACDQQECYRHTPLSYTEARQKLFGDLFLIRNNQLYALPDLYCETILDEQDFPKGKGPGPGRVPDIDIMNTEHAWPQSHFSNKFSKKLQKADLHILFPVSSRSNSLRNNHPYGEVTRSTHQVCAPSSLGYTMANERVVAFMPPVAQRGEFARASFYFSTRYKMTLDPEQETSLRRWHLEDPVSADEVARNNAIFQTQHSRNPFTDHPEWVDAIPDF